MSGVALAAGATGPLQHVPQSLQPLINEHEKEANHRAIPGEQQSNSEQPNSEQGSENNQSNDEQSKSDQVYNEQTNNNNEKNSMQSNESLLNDQSNTQQQNIQQQNTQQQNTQQPNSDRELPSVHNATVPSSSAPAPAPVSPSAPAPAPGPESASASVSAPVSAPESSVGPESSSAPTVLATAPTSEPLPMSSHEPALASTPASDSAPISSHEPTSASVPTSEQQDQPESSPLNGSPQAIAPKTEPQGEDQVNESESVRLHRRQAPHIQVRPGATICQNCFTTTTPLWRRDETGQIMCNACGLFLKLHGRRRPISLKTDVIKSRNRSNRQNRMDRHNAARRKQMATPVAVQSVHSQNLAIRQAQQAQQQAEKQAQRQARHQAQQTQQTQQQLLQQPNVATVNGTNGAPELVRTDTNSPMQPQQRQSLSPRTQQQTPLPPQQPRQIPGMSQMQGMPPHLASVLHHPLNGLPGLASSLASLPLMYPGAQGLNYLGQGLNPQSINPQGMMMNSPILGPQGGPITQSTHLAPGSQLGMAPLGQPLSPQIVAQTGGGPMLTNRMPARGAMSELLLPCSPDLIDRIPHLAQIPVAQFQQQSEQQQQEQNRMSIAQLQRSQQNSPQQLSSEPQNYQQGGQKENQQRSITPPNADHSASMEPNTPNKSPSGQHSHRPTSLSTDDSAQLMTRVSELELVNDLLRRRVQDLEASELRSRQQVDELKSQLASANDHAAQHPQSPLSKRIKVSELV